MSWISDEALTHLRSATDEPDLSGTRYRIVREVGRGGMGTVYLAEDLELERRVALKVLSSGVDSEQALPRLRQEARILARLEHPGILPVHDLGVLPDGRAYYVMKYVDGERLDRHVGESMPLHERLGVFARICEAVGFANSRGTLHRDLKPENIMVGPFGEVVVLDWGVAKVLGTLESEAPTVPRSTEVGVTEQGTVIGTPGWMAPEQARGEVGELDRRADVYGLGALLYWLITLTRPDPEHPRPPRRSNPAVSRPLQAVCMMALAPDPEDRFDSAEALARDVRASLLQEPVSAWPEGPMRRLARIGTKHRALVLLVLAYLLARVLVFLWQFSKGNGADVG
jgi:serine/threonine protein kinase